MINAAGFASRRRRLRSEIRHAKRKAAGLTGTKAKCLWDRIAELEEQVAAIECIQDDRAFAFQALYYAPCYGPPQ